MVARVLERSNSGRNSSVLQSLGKSKSIYLVHSVMTGEPSSDIFVIWLCLCMSFCRSWWGVKTTAVLPLDVTTSAYTLCFTQWHLNILIAPQSGPKWDTKLGCHGLSVIDWICNIVPVQTYYIFFLGLYLKHLNLPVCHKICTVLGIINSLFTRFRVLNLAALFVSSLLAYANSSNVDMSLDMSRFFNWVE